MQAKAAYSRTVQAIVGQMVEIPFRGTGWVYLGEQESRPGIAYDARRLEKEGQNFVFKTESPGTYILTFYKQDFIEDYMINDFVQVIVSPVPQDLGSSRTSLSADRGRVIAEPRWPPLPEDSTAPASIRLPPAELPPVAVPPPEVPPPTLPSIDYLQQAREAYTAGQFPQAISSLDQFQEQYPAGTDEAWWLYGQSLEAASPSRDIRSALDYYRRLIREYPQSPRGNDARRRIAYLDRYYFTIQ
jgi:tetratricopeptide (TPR) repeat protein